MGVLWNKEQLFFQVMYTGRNTVKCFEFISLEQPRQDQSIIVFSTFAVTLLTSKESGSDEHKA